MLSIMIRLIQVIAKLLIRSLKNQQVIMRATTRTLTKICSRGESKSYVRDHDGATDQTAGIIKEAEEAIDEATL